MRESESHSSSPFLSLHTHQVVRRGGLAPTWHWLQAPCVRTEVHTQRERDKAIYSTHIHIQTNIHTYIQIHTHQHIHTCIARSKPSTLTVILVFPSDLVRPSTSSSMQVYIHIYIISLSVSLSLHTYIYISPPPLYVYVSLLLCLCMCMCVSYTSSTQASLVCGRLPWIMKGIVHTHTRTHNLSLTLSNTHTHTFAHTGISMWEEQWLW